MPVLNINPLKALLLTDQITVMGNEMSVQASRFAHVLS